MKHPTPIAFRLLATTVPMTLALLLGACQTRADQPLPHQPSTSKAFIVYCQCAVPADKQRIANDIQRIGGRILYLYAEINGMAVAAPAQADPQRFIHGLENIPGVLRAVADSMSQTTYNGGSTGAQ